VCERKTHIGSHFLYTTFFSEHAEVDKKAQDFAYKILDIQSTDLSTILSSLLHISCRNSFVFKTQEVLKGNDYYFDGST
jgi:hypothetical protein